MSGARFARTRMGAASADELLGATDVADLLVRYGLPFREAHGVVAGLVRGALEQGRTLSQLTPAELAAASPLLGEHADEYYAALRPEAWLESKVSEGGTALVRVREQLALARAVLDGEGLPEIDSTAALERERPLKSFKSKISKTTSPPATADREVHGAPVHGRASDDDAAR